MYSLGRTLFGGFGSTAPYLPGFYWTCPPCLHHYRSLHCLGFYLPYHLRAFLFRYYTYLPVPTCTCPMPYCSTCMRFTTTWTIILLCHYLLLPATTTAFATAFLPPLGTPCSATPFVWFWTMSAGRVSALFVSPTPLSTTYHHHTAGILLRTFERLRSATYVSCHCRSRFYWSWDLFSTGLFHTCCLPACYTPADPTPVASHHTPPHYHHHHGTGLPTVSSPGFFTTTALPHLSMLPMLHTWFAALHFLPRFRRLLVPPYLRCHVLLHSASFTHHLPILPHLPAHHLP